VTWEVRVLLAWLNRNQTVQISDQCYPERKNVLGMIWEWEGDVRRCDFPQDPPLCIRVQRNKLPDRREGGQVSILIGS
jgi:hypothetical protein